MVLYKNKSEELGMYKEYEIDWTQLRTADNENPQILPGKIWTMLHAQSEDTSTDEVYWTIENNAFFNRELYEATEPVTTVITHEIHVGNYTTIGLRYGLDLLVEIACGWSAPSEKERGNADLADRCREKIRAIMPDLYRLAETQTDQRVLQGIVDLTDELEPSKQQRAKILSIVEPKAYDERLIRMSLRDLRKSLRRL
jgi:hypothetical protein